MKRRVVILIVLIIQSKAYASNILPTNSITTYPQTITLGQIKESEIQKQVFEFLTPIYKKLGIELDTIGLPAKRSLTLSNDGDLDGELLRAEHIEKDYSNLVAVPITLYQLNTYAYIIEKEDNKKTIKDLIGTSIAVHRGIQWEENFAKQFPSDIVWVGSTKRKFKLLTVGKVNYVVSDKQRADKIIKEYFPKIKIKRVLPILKQINLIHYLNKKHASIIPALIDEIKKKQHLLPLVL